MIKDLIIQLKNISYLQLQDPLLTLFLWQYLVILILFFGIRLVILIVLKIFLYKFSNKKGFAFVVKKIQITHSYTLALFVFVKIVIPNIELPHANDIVSNIILALHFLSIALLILLFYKIVDLLFLCFQETLPKSSSSKIYFLPFLKRVSKIIVTILSITILPRFFIIYDITGLLGKLSLSIGLMTTAIAFALKNTIHNFIGGIIIVMERILSKGDSVKIADVQGMVMNMNFRTTIIKLDNGSIVHVPNSVFTNKNLTNHGHITKKNFIMKLVIDDLGLSSLDAFLKGFYDIVRKHPEAIEKKCNVKLNTIESNVFSLSFDLAFKPITKRKSILYSCEIVNQIKKLASSMTIKLQA